jgi:hypothetical protein
MFIKTGSEEKIITIIDGEKLTEEQKEAIKKAKEEAKNSVSKKAN